MTWVDFAVLGVLAVSGLLAFLRGFVREILGIGAWVGAALAAAWGVQFTRVPLERWIDNPTWVEPVGLLGIFLVTLIVLLLIARLVGGMVRGSPLGGVDRTLGLLFGLARGAALVILAYILAGMAVPLTHWPNPVLEARTLTPAYEGARWAVERLPVRFRPPVPAPPAGPRTSADALLRAAPQGRAIGN